MRESDLLLWEFVRPLLRQQAYPDSPGHKPGAPETSQAAALATKPQARTLRLAVLSQLDKGDNTADETAAALGESVLSIRPRFSELLRLGKIHDTGLRRTNASGRNAVVWALRLALLITFGVLRAGQLPELAQTDLEPTEQVQVCAVPYNNSLFIKPMEPGYLGDDHARRFQCGQTVRIKSNPDQIAVVMDYRQQDGVWMYQLKPAHYEGQ